MALRLREDSFDSRDEHTTELVFDLPLCERLNLERIEIDPFVVFLNMLENCFPGPDVENVDEQTLVSLQHLYSVQRQIRAVLDRYPSFVPAG
jgi:hypothetical protein